MSLKKDHLQIAVTKKQLAFLKADATEVLFGGAAGGGAAPAGAPDGGGGFRPGGDDGSAH